MQVESSFISDVLYEPDSDDATTGTVTLTFKDGAVFAYQGVDFADYEALVRAPSVGKWFHANFKRKYTGSRA
jgi:hypothetical protein